MTSKELAELLNCRQYRKETTPEIIQLAKDNGLVIVYGYSDDNTEFKGAISEEIPCYEGGKIYFNKDGSNFTDVNGMAFLTYHKDKDEPDANMVESVWDENEKIMHEGTGLYYSWTFKTEIPHETFDIFDEGDPYCRGIVFSINDLK